jgi:hypothetical protein
VSVQYVLAAAFAAVLIAFIAAPLLAKRREQADDGDAARVADLELRKEGKYREIRDAQLDHAAGKLSDEDFAKLDGALRREAVAILAELDRAEADRRRAGA